MVGGTVIETIELEDRVWINTKDHGDTCAIYVKACAKARSVAEGDTVWWQGNMAMWTPVCLKYLGDARVGGKHYDIQLRRIGYSGVKRPDVS